MARVCLCVLGVAALAFAGLAAGAERLQVRFNKADQAAARAAVVRAGDFGRTAGWKGGRQQPDISGSSPCADFQPKTSDLVLTGAAASAYGHRSGLGVQTTTHVLRTRAMVRLDWQRIVENPRLLTCLRSVFANAARTPGARLVSVKRIAFPRLATYTAAYRVVMEVRASGRRVRVLVDMILLGRSRTEITLTATAPYARRADAVALEKRLARRLLARVRA